MTKTGVDKTIKVVPTVGLGPPTEGEIDDWLTEGLARVERDLYQICRTFRLEQDAEDLIQRAAILALKKREAIRSLDPWLKGVIRRYCLAEVRKRQGRLRQNASLSEHVLVNSFEAASLEVCEGLDLARLRGVLSARDLNLLWLSFGVGANPACRLWERLPQALRRREPNSGEEIELVARLVEEACEGGLALAEALRISGLHPQLYRAVSAAPKRAKGASQP